MRARKLGMAVLWGGCSEADLALPYLPFLEALGNYLAVADLGQVGEQLGPLRYELAHLFPQLAPESPQRDGGDPIQAKFRLFEAVLALIAVPARTQGLLLVLEDLHWADASTRELLDYLSRRLRGIPLLLLATYRSDELHRKHPLLPLVQGWRRTQPMQVIQLEPLRPEAMAAMVQAILGEGSIGNEFSTFLHARTEGNPFVLEEFLKAAIDRGDVYRTARRWERKQLSELKLPQTIKDTILLRLERLTSAQVDILHTASVLGPSFRYQTLVDVTGREEVTVQDALQASVHQQLMEEVSQQTGRYRFRHALTREAVYEDLITPRREQLHARAAEVLRAQTGTAAADLAFHLIAANRWDEAIPVAIKAAEDAERSYAYLVAAATYERIVPHIGGSLVRGQMLCRLGSAYQQSAEPGRAQGYLEDGIKFLEGAGEFHEAARYRLLLGRSYWEQLRPDLARIEYERARDTLEPEGPSEDLANAYIRLAGLHLFDLEDSQGLETGERALAMAVAAHSEHARIWALGYVGIALAGLGRVNDGLAKLDESYEAALTRGELNVARYALFNGILNRIYNFRTKEALSRIPLLRQIQVDNRPHPLDFHNEGRLHFFLGFPRKALDQFEQALALALERQALHWIGWSQGWLAMTLSELDRLVEARKLLPSLDSQKEHQDQAWLISFTIRILVRAGDLDGAARVAERMLTERWGGGFHLRIASDTAVEALVLAGRVEEARQLVTLTRREHQRDPYQDRIEGRLALADSNLLVARERLAAAAAFFRKVEFGLEEMRTRRPLADVLLQMGDRADSEAELRAVLAEAERREAVFEGQSAQRQLADMGIQVGVEHLPTAQQPIGEPGERLVTVMFVDVRGYTPMSAKEAPSELADRLAILYRWSRQEIERHHGLVDKYEGDAVMAIFNVPGARLDHCLQAVRAAIAIRDKADAAGLPVGIGIAVGPAVVGALTEAAPPSAYGEVSNLASRLQAQAGAGEVLLSDEAYRRSREWLGEHGLTISKETLSLKGFEAPLTAYRLARPVSAGSTSAVRT